MAWRAILVVTVAANAASAPATAGSRQSRAPERPLVRATTARYDLRVQGTAEEAATFGTILEAAWPTFRKFFGVEPRLERDERLLVKLFDTREACLDGAMGDRADMPPAKHPAWFSPRNGTVYLYRHTSDWFTRYLLIYGGCLQFHGLSKSKNLDLDAWYTHGVAESFAVHSLEGDRLELAAKPPICWIDHPARALAALGGERLGLDPFTEERLEDPSVRWALVRFAVDGAGGRYRQRFEKLALGFTGSKLSGHDFMRSLGDERRVAEEFSVWLLASQMPLEVVVPDWEAYPDGRIVARPKDWASFCVVKRGFTSIEALVELRAGSGVPAIVLSFQDNRNYAVARIVPPVVLVERVRDGAAGAVETLALESSHDRVRLSAARKGGAVHLAIDGQDRLNLDLPDGRVGLAATGGEAIFREIKCR